MVLVVVFHEEQEEVVLGVVELVDEYEVGVVQVVGVDAFLR